MKEQINFKFELPGELTEKQAASLLPIFLLMQEKQMEAPRVNKTSQMDVNMWQFSRLENGDLSVNGYWTVKD